MQGSWLDPVGKEDVADDGGAPRLSPTARGGQGACKRQWQWRGASGDARGRGKRREEGGEWG